MTRLRLVGRRSSGDTLRKGPYTLCIATSAGEFSADVRVVALQEIACSWRFSANASIFGLELRVYRLIIEEDAGANAALRRGDRLMVALAGNATVY